MKLLLDHYENLEQSPPPPTQPPVADQPPVDLDALSLDELLALTAGTWKHGDGLAWQAALRGEWDERRP